MKYVARDAQGKLHTVNLQELHPTWTVFGKIPTEEENNEDPFMHPINPYATIDDFTWPDNMFDKSIKVRLSKYRS